MKQSKRAAGIRTVSAQAGKARARAARQEPVPESGRRGRDRPSKQDLLVDRLMRPEGAKIDDLTRELGWLPHTVRAALTGLRHKGYVIVRDKADGEVSVYRAALPSAEKRSKSPSVKKGGRTTRKRAA